LGSGLDARHGSYEDANGYERYDLIGFDPNGVGVKLYPSIDDANHDRNGTRVNSGAKIMSIGSVKSGDENYLGEDSTPSGAANGETVTYIPVEYNG
jgi:hypothetical protein